MPDMATIKGLHLGEQYIHSDEDLTFCRQMGVEYVQPEVASLQLEAGVKGLDLRGEDYWDVDSLVKFKEHIESFGLKLGLMPLPRQKWPSIMRGTPERDRAIEQICKCIEAAAKAEVSLVGWGFGVDVGLLRNPGRTFGRSATMYSHYGRGGIISPAFDYSKMKEGSPHSAGPISAEQAWERIEYVVKRVIPVAEEYKVRMASHPNDVPIPPGTTYRGIAPVLSNIDGLKRFADLSSSPYHGLLFCQGCVAEFSTSLEQVYETIRYFGERKKIFWVHFRNIRGGYLKFEETFPDEGDIDMLKAMRIYKEAGYNGVLIPDHIPKSDLDAPWGHRSRAYCYGYIKALIHAVESEN